MRSKNLSIVALFLLMLVTGVFWGTWFTLTRSLEVFSVGEFIHIGKTIITNVAWPMRILMPGTILLMSISLWINRDQKNLAMVFGLLAWLLVIAVLLVTLIVLVPIDNQIKTWTDVSAPDNWTSLRNTWDQFHTLRTFLSIGSFLCFLLFLVGSGRETVDRSPENLN